MVNHWWVCLMISQLNHGGWIYKSRWHKPNCATNNASEASIFRPVASCARTRLLVEGLQGSPIHRSPCWFAPQVFVARDHPFVATNLGATPFMDSFPGQSKAWERLNYGKGSSQWLTSSPAIQLVSPKCHKNSSRRAPKAPSWKLLATGTENIMWIGVAFVCDPCI